MIVHRVGHYPVKHRIGILQGGGELVPRGQPIGKIHNGKAMLGQAHTVILIKVFIAIDPAAAVNADNHGKCGASGVLGR